MADDLFRLFLLRKMGAHWQKDAFRRIAISGPSLQDRVPRWCFPYGRFFTRTDVGPEPDKRNHPVTLDQSSQCCHRRGMENVDREITRKKSKLYRSGNACMIQERCAKKNLFQNQSDIADKSTGFHIDGSLLDSLRSEASRCLYTPLILMQHRGFKVSVKCYMAYHISSASLSPLSYIAQSHFGFFL